MEWVSLDDWKPTPKLHRFRVPSEWRKKQNSKTVECDPDADDLKNIKAHIAHGVPDEEIQEIFNISSFTFKKIKRGKYSMYGTRNENPTKEMRKEIQSHALKMYQDLKDEIRIEYDLSSTCFDELMEDCLFKKKKKKKKEQTEDILPIAEEIQCDDEEENELESDVELILNEIPDANEDELIGEHDERDESHEREKEI